ncbi:transcriptional repressor [Geranomyces variabilis]|nr:transcriptional repressor [Geranomyces variabilis]
MSLPNSFAPIQYQPDSPPAAKTSESRPWAFPVDTARRTPQHGLDGFTLAQDSSSADCYVPGMRIPHSPQFQPAPPDYLTVPRVLPPPFPRPEVAAAYNYCSTFPAPSPSWNQGLRAGQWLTPNPASYLGSLQPPAALWQQLPALDPAVASVGHVFPGPAAPMTTPYYNNPYAEGHHQLPKPKVRAASAAEISPVRTAQVDLTLPAATAPAASPVTVTSASLDEPKPKSREKDIAKHARKRSASLKASKSKKKPNSKLTPPPRKPAAKARTFKCDHIDCYKTFTTAGHLVRHVKSHSGEKPFSCPISGCTARFTRHDNMMQHHRLHLRKLDEATKRSDNVTSASGTTADGEVHDVDTAAACDPIDRALDSPSGSYAQPEHDQQSTTARLNTRSQSQPSFLDDYSTASSLHPYDRGPLSRETASPLSGIYFGSRGPLEIPQQIQLPSALEVPHSEPRLLPPNETRDATCNLNLYAQQPAIPGDAEHNLHDPWSGQRSHAFQARAEVFNGSDPRICSPRSTDVIWGDGPSPTAASRSYNHAKSYSGSNRHIYPSSSPIMFSDDDHASPTAGSLSCSSSWSDSNSSHSCCQSAPHTPTPAAAASPARAQEAPSQEHCHDSEASSSFNNWTPTMTLSSPRHDELPRAGPVTRQQKRQQQASPTARILTSTFEPPSYFS